MDIVIFFRAAGRLPLANPGRTALSSVCELRQQNLKLLAVWRQSMNCWCSSQIKPAICRGMAVTDLRQKESYHVLKAHSNVMYSTYDTYSECHDNELARWVNKLANDPQSLI